MRRRGAALPGLWSVALAPWATSLRVGGAANVSLTSQVTGVVSWYSSADEPRALDYNDYNQPGLYNPDAYCPSDHDPAIVGSRLGETTLYWLYLPLVACEYTSP